VSGGNGADNGYWCSVAPDEIFSPGRYFRLNQTTGQSEVFEPPGMPPPHEPTPTPTDELSGDHLDFLTVLTSVHGKGGAKQYTRIWDKDLGRYVVTEKAFSKESHFSFETIPLAGPEDFFAALNRVALQFTSFVVRGAPIAGTELSNARKRHLNRDGIPATLEATPHHWWLTDHDDIPAPVLTDIVTDPLAAVEHVIGLMPECFHDATCWFAFSSSAGMKRLLKPNDTSPETISLRLGWWFDEPHTDAEFKRLAAKINADAGFKLVDPCLYTPSQPNYVAAPKFIGMRDPLPLRFELRRGLDLVVNSEIPAPSYRPRRVAAAGSGGSSGGADYWISQIGGALGFLEPMKKAIAAFIGDWGAEAHIEPLRAQIEKRFAEADAGDRTQATLDGYLAQIDNIAAAIRALQGDTLGRLVPDPAPRFKRVDPPFPLPTASRAEVHTAISTGIDDFFNTPLRWGDNRPRRVLLGGITGSGKSEALGKKLPHQIAAWKAKNQSAKRQKLPAQPHRVVVAVETHHLGKQIAERYRAMIDAAGLAGKITVATFEGRGDPFPSDDIPNREYLCKNLKEVGLAILADADVAKTVCGAVSDSGPAGYGNDPAAAGGDLSAGQCPFRADCAYFHQITDCADADIVIVAHNFVFQPLPKAILHDLACVIIEENFTDHGTGRVELPVVTFYEEALRQHPVLITKGKLKGHPDHAKTAELNALFSKIERINECLEGGMNAIEAVTTAGLSPKEYASARAINWKRKVEHKMQPGMSLEERKARKEACAYNLTLHRIAAVLHALEEIAKAILIDAGGVDPLLGERLWVDGLDLIVPGLRAPDKWLAELPVIIASATARLSLVQKFFPTVEHVEPPTPALPHQHVHQILGSFGKNATLKKLDDLIVDYRLRTLGSAGRNLLVTHKTYESGFKGIDGLDTRHHGDISGDDDYGDVDHLFVIGGPFATRRDIASRASAETRHRVLETKSVRTPCAGLLTTGQGIAFERLAYADPDMMAVHADIYDTAIVQAIGRGRGINRYESTPLHVYVYANLPLSMPVTTFERYRRPSRLDRMYLSGRPVPVNSALMASLYPDLFGSGKNPADAARKARDDWGKAEGMQARVRELAEREGVAFDVVLCQPAGQGHKARPVFVRHDKLAEGRADIERAVGGPCRIYRIERPITPGRAGAGVSEDQEIDRNEDLFLSISDSSEKRRPLRARLAPPGLASPRRAGRRARQSCSNTTKRPA
jgi:hypothetical protein